MPRRNPQLSLDLRDTPRWGGRRAGAGRKPGKIRRDPHRRRPALGRTAPCHVTLKVRAGLPSLRSARFVRAFAATLRSGCERGRFRVVHWSVQQDHLHLIVEASSTFDLACGMKAVTLRVVRAVQRVFGLGRRGAVLRDRFHLHVLRSPREVRRALAYVLLNARRHAAQRGVALARMVTRVDAASSGRWFDGWTRRSQASGSADDAGAGDAPAVARARSWLLAIGWRRAGLIDASEVPGRGGSTRSPGRRIRPVSR
jgi:REP element-mobilizing transposase RayT